MLCVCVCVCETDYWLHDVSVDAGVDKEDTIKQGQSLFQETKAGFNRENLKQLHTAWANQHVESATYQHWSLFRQ